MQGQRNLKCLAHVPAVVHFIVEPLAFPARFRFEIYEESKRRLRTGLNQVLKRQNGPDSGRNGSRIIVRLVSVSCKQLMQMAPSVRVGKCCLTQTIRAGGKSLATQRSVEVCEKKSLTQPKDA